MLFDSDRVLICKGNISDLAGIEVIATGTRNNGLYYLSYQLPSPGTALLGKKKHRNHELHPQHRESFLIWHLRAGHISSIKRTVELQVGHNLPRVLYNDKTDCVLGCVSGKLSRSPHIKIEPRCDFNYGEFIHVKKKIGLVQGDFPCPI